MSDWIKISDREPTKEERENNIIMWWNLYESGPYVGEYLHYDGKWIRISTRSFYLNLPYYEFTHWKIVDEPEGGR